MLDKRNRITAVGVFISVFIALQCWMLLDYRPSGPLPDTRDTSLTFLSIVGFATVANVWILYMHATTPPHPKFLLLPSRKLSIRAHAIGGGFESIFAVAAWFTGSATLAVVTALFALLLHVPASYYQTQGTFGMKSVNVPGYYYIVTVHAYCAVRVLQTQGTEIAWLERTYVALMAYSYFRIFFYIFLKFDAFRGSQYTVSLLMSGAILLPLVFGRSGFSSALVAMGVYLAAFKFVVKPTEREWRDLFEEKERFSLLDGSLRKQWLTLNIGNPDAMTPDEQAKAVFDKLDKDKSGVLDKTEVEQLLTSWGASERLSDSFFYHYGDRTSIGFGAFVSTFWLSDRFVPQEIKDAQGSRHEQAKLVFEHIDVDNTGFIELAEVEMLLLEWGMDLYEARRYMKRFAGADGKLSLDEFEKQMAPIWQFGYETLAAGRVSS